jgi:hypothetical protein
LMTDWCIEFWSYLLLLLLLGLWWILMTII